MDGNPLKLFALESSRPLGERIVAALNVELGGLEELDFPDGEHKSRPLESVRKHDVFVLHSLYADERESVHDKLCRLLFFVGALRDASAALITAVIPYLCYAREDQRTRPRDPVTTRYVAKLLEASGLDHVVVLDVHDLAAFQNAFSIRTDHLQASPLFVRHFVSLLAADDVVVLSPDVGGIKRAEQFREALGRGLGRTAAGAFMTKRRADGMVRGEASVVGTVEGRTVLIYDDMISTGETIRRAVRACRQAGARSIYAVATHGLFAANASEMVADPTLKQVIVTDTVPPFRLEPALATAKVVVLGTAPLFAEAIRRIHEGGSLADLASG